MARLLFTFLFIFLSQSSMAGVYELKFRRVAAFNDPQSCRTFVEKTAHELEVQSTARVIESGCREDGFTFKGLDAILVYQASERLSLTSTDTGSVYLAAFYKNREACEAQLEAQKELFTKKTGLEPLSAYCMLSVMQVSAWQTRVDGLGNSKVKPGTVGLTISGSIVNEKAVVEKFKNESLGENLTISEIGVSGYGFDKRLVIRYYAPERYVLRDYDEMQYASAGNCPAAVVTVSTMLKAAHKSAVVFCESEGSYATLHVTSFKKLLAATNVFDARKLGMAYATLGTCQQAAEKMAQSSSDILGAVCAGQENAFYVHVFSEP